VVGTGRARLFPIVTHSLGVAPEYRSSNSRCLVDVVLRFLLALVGYQEPLRAGRGLELGGPSLARQVVTDSQRVALELVNSEELFPLVRTLDTGNVHGFGLGRPVRFHRTAIDSLAERQGVLAVLELQLDRFAGILRQWLPAQLSRAGNPCTVQGIGFGIVAANRRGKAQYQRKYGAKHEPHDALPRESSAWCGIAL